ncbi:hypothetical protein ACE3LZ_13045 [Staphylococcus saprophyticus]|uniref:hypothetical protein n=1 Tax=Staphylococcus saprophyticus TaxID=29385 RepID=UPI00365E751C
MPDLLVVGLFLFVTAIHRYVLSYRRQVWPGAIVPVIYTIFVIFVIARSNHNLSFVDYIPFTLGLTILLAFWIDGHYSYEKKIEKELDSTKAKDNQ